MGVTFFLIHNLSLTCIPPYCVNNPLPPLAILVALWPIHRSIHRINHHSIHRSLHQAIYHVCLIVMYDWTTHFSHPVILCPALSFPHHRSILPTINRSIHRSNHNSTHYSLHQAIYHIRLIVVYDWTTPFSPPVILCPALSFPHRRSLLPPLNRSIHHFNHHSTHRSLRQALSHVCLIVVYVKTNHPSHPVLLYLALSLSHDRSLLPSYIVFSGYTVPFAFLFQPFVSTSPLCRPVTRSI